MAADEALATCLSPGEGVLRLYRWSSPTVSFGRNEPADGLYDLEAARQAGIHFVRRPTGGRAVLHDRELTYAIVIPITAGMSVRALYRLVNQGLVSSLDSLGVPASMAPGGSPTLSLDAGPCFEHPAEGEVTVSGRKLVGSAQARLGSAILQHGSLLIGPGQQRLADLRGAVDDGPAPICLEEILDAVPSWDVLVEAVVVGVSGVLGGEWHRGGLSDAERAESKVLNSRYASHGWTWRR
jgi:lipoate-protein ligase A